MQRRICRWNDRSLMYKQARLKSISLPKLRSPWQTVRKRELWEHPFQACAIDTIDADCALRSETGCAKFGYFLCHFKMDAPRVLVFRPLVKGNETPGTRLVLSGNLKKKSCIINYRRMNAKLNGFSLAKGEAQFCFTCPAGFFPSTFILFLTKLRRVGGPGGPGAPCPSTRSATGKQSSFLYSIFPALDYPPCPARKISQKAIWWNLYWPRLARSRWPRFFWRVYGTRLRLGP